MQPLPIPGKGRWEAPRCRGETFLFLVPFPVPCPASENAPFPAKACCLPPSCLPRNGIANGSIPAWVSNGTGRISSPERGGGNAAPSEKEKAPFRPPACRRGYTPAAAKVFHFRLSRPFPARFTGCGAFLSERTLRLRMRRRDSPWPPRRAKRERSVPALLLRKGSGSSAAPPYRLRGPRQAAGRPSSKARFRANWRGLPRSLPR